MDFKMAILNLEKSPEFRDFKKQHVEYYLANLFYTVTGAKEDVVVSYYSKSKDRMISFTTDPVSVSDEQEVFKKEGAVPRLDLSKVKVSYDKVKNLTEKILKENYPGETITKTIWILQHHGKVMYNITLVTSSFNIINLKIDAVDGRLLSRNKQSIMDLGAGLKK